jgi:Undecaprenyl-phosphate glucose phosphotransferase
VRYSAETQALREREHVGRLEKAGWRAPPPEVAATRPSVRLGVATAGRNLNFSRTFLLVFITASLGLMTLGRGAVRHLLQILRSRGINTRSIAIFGAGRLGQTLLNKIRGSPWTGLVARYFVEEDPNLIGHEVHGVKVFGPLAQTKQILEAHPVDEVYVAIGHAQQGRLGDVLNDISDACQTIRMVPDTLSLLTLNCSASDIDGLVIVSLTDSPIYGWRRLVKHALDRLLALVALTVLGIPMLVIAALVKLKGGPGPVFYKQTRCSLAGQSFSMLKFRTMSAAAETDGPGWTVRDDPRVTPIGRFLRKTSLDELPQLINVLRGDMSLVGPRPERPEFIEKFRRSIPKYALRHSVKAGITGWAQVHGHRGDTSIKKRLQYDLHYVENWSLWLDFRILVLTAVRGFVHRNAY